MANLHNLEFIDVSRCQAISDNGVAALIVLTRLHTLDLGDCHLLTDRSLKCLAALPQLQLLILGNCPDITRDGITELERFMSEQRAAFSFGVMWDDPEQWMENNGRFGDRYVPNYPQPYRPEYDDNDDEDFEGAFEADDSEASDYEE